MSGRVLIVGDVHGCVDELDALLDALAPGRDDSICLLGDYIDRGPRSKAVIDRLIRLRDEGPACVFLKGNHEDMFLAFLGFPGRYGEAFLRNGGGATLASYALERVRARELAERLPAEHREFLLSLRTQARFGSVLCVHAGVRPGVALEAQSEEDLLWIRDGFVDRPHRLPLTVVFGHTPVRDVLLDLPFKIGLDTGLVYGNRLSCLELPAGRLWQIERDTRVLHRRAIAGDLACLSVAPT